MPSDCLRFLRMIRPAFIEDAEAPTTAALRGASRREIFERGRETEDRRRFERRALPSAATHLPSAQRSSGLTSSSSSVGLPRQFEGEKTERFLESDSSRAATSSSARGAFALAL